MLSSVRSSLLYRPSRTLTISAASALRLANCSPLCASNSASFSPVISSQDKTGVAQLDFDLFKRGSFSFEVVNGFRRVQRNHLALPAGFLSFGDFAFENFPFRKQTGLRFRFSTPSNAPLQIAIKGFARCRNVSLFPLPLSALGRM